MSEKKDKFCRYCGAPLRPHWGFCKSCGRMIIGRPKLEEIPEVQKPKKERIEKTDLEEIEKIKREKQKTERERIKQEKIDRERQEKEKKEREEREKIKQEELKERIRIENLKNEINSFLDLIPLKESKTKKNLEKDVEKLMEYRTISLKESFSQRFIIMIDSKISNINRLIEKSEVQEKKKSLMEIGTKFKRIRIDELSEQSGIKGKEFLVEMILSMIDKLELYAEYLPRRKLVLFNTMANINVKQKLIDAIKD